MANPLELNIDSILKPNGSFQPPSTCGVEFKRWTSNLYMAFRSNKTKATPYLQRGIDVVYSHLEVMKHKHHKKLSDSYGFSALDVTNDPVWMVLRSQIRVHFKKIIREVRPSRTPLENIRFKCINRTTYNFLQQQIRLIESLKTSIVKKGELGRIQLEVIDAQLDSLKSLYDQKESIDNNIWKILNDQHKRNLYTAICHKGIKTGYEDKASAKDSALSTENTLDLFAEAKIEIKRTWDFRNIVRNQVSAKAGVEGRVKVNTDLHAKFGSNGGAGVMKGRAGEPEIGITGNAGVSQGLGKYTNFSQAELENRNGFAPMQLIPGIDIGVNIELAAKFGLMVEVSHELSIGQLFALQSEASLFVGAEVKAQINGAFNSSNILGADEFIVGAIGGSAFIGAKAKGSVTTVFKARSIDAARFKIEASVSAGAGINATVEAAVRGSGDLKVRVAAGLTAGIGTDFDTETMVNPLLLKILLWDKLASHLTTKAYRKRKNEKYDRSVNIVALSRCQSKALTYMSILDQSYRLLAEELWRISVVTDFTGSDIEGMRGTLPNLFRPPELKAAYLRSIDDSDDELTNAQSGVERAAEARFKERKGARTHSQQGSLLILEPQG
ncbi:hypothetical protein [Vibrio mediterranei]|uniref:hypothetical protein n=1 Tax=Vibrio mediterranei TaxID=689 RepID=UPI00148CCE50|nr:hypothetical protein [Vibrio mediterranei]NOI26377.1 hypothetical protein [Vibrio mediterranei]